MNDTALITAFALAIAVGLGPYPALVTLGIAARAGAVELPDALSGLAAPMVWGTLAALWAVELWATRYRTADFTWNAFHTIVRPLAASLAAGSLLAGDPRSVQWMAAFGGLILGLLVHVQLFGLRVVARTLPGRPSPAVLAAAQVLLGAGLALGAVVDPPLAAALALLAVVLPLPWTPPLGRAAWLAAGALWRAATWGGRGGRGGWRFGTDVFSTATLDATARFTADSPDQLRTAPVTLASQDRRWIFRRGDLVVASDGLIFVTRAASDARPLPVGSDPIAVGSPVLESVRVEEQGGYVLCLDASAPPATAIVAEMRSRAQGRTPAASPSGTSAGQRG